VTLIGVSRDPVLNREVERPTPIAWRAFQGENTAAPCACDLERPVGAANHHEDAEPQDTREAFRQVQLLIERKDHDGNVHVLAD
jgi:hypothetical protein